MCKHFDKSQFLWKILYTNSIRKSSECYKMPKVIKDKNNLWLFLFSLLFTDYTKNKNFYNKEYYLKNCFGRIDNDKNKCS